MADRIVCFRHPEYDGSWSPLLACRICCTIYLDVLKQLQDVPPDVLTGKQLDIDITPEGRMYGALRDLMGGDDD